jgi:hypothetical protein
MKVSWRLTAEQQPSDGRKVLTSDSIVAYYDGELWYDWHSDIVLKNPLFWMEIPGLPGE